MQALILRDLTPAQLADAAIENLMVHAGYIPRHMPGMQVVDFGGVIATDCGLPCDTFNQVIRARMTPENAPQHIREVMDFYAARRHPYAWWVSPGDEPANLGDFLLDAGFHVAENDEAMAADLLNLTRFDTAPGGLQIRRVRTQAEMRDFMQIAASNWSPPDENLIRYYEMAGDLLYADDCPLWFYVGYLDDVPVACAEQTIGGGVAGLYSVCTLEQYRRRGFGAALTLQPLLDARDAGYRTGVLQAAAPVYERLGFVKFGPITEYQPGFTLPD